MKSSLFASILLFSLSGTPVDAICRAVDGKYSEPESTARAVGNTLAQVDMKFAYELTPKRPATVAISSFTQSRDNMIVSELQHRIADALVFTLFDDCRVDPNDKMSVVNLRSIQVTVTAPKDPDSSPYNVEIVAVGDTDIANDNNAQALAQMRLENAVRITMNMHHVATVGLKDGIILTIQKEPAEPPSGEDKDKSHGDTPPTRIPPSSRPIYTTVAAASGALAVVSLLVSIVVTRWSHNDHFSLPDNEIDDVELACTCKPTDKLVPPEVLDETEISESSTSYEDEEW